MRVAVMGKGGAGKTALSTALIRTLAGGGSPVLALDLDTNPGLALSFGLDPDAGGLPEEAIEEREGVAYGFGLATGLDPATVVERYGVEAAPNVTFLGLGAITDMSKSVKRHLSAVLEVARGFREPGWSVVGDMEAGTTTPFEGYGRFADFAVVVVNASPASTLAATRILGILEHEKMPSALVVSKAKPGDVELVEEELGPVFASVPFDPAVRAADRRGPVVPSTSPAQRAADELLERLGSLESMEVRS